MKISSRFKGCILGGAIGDAWGSCYENVKREVEDENIFYFLGNPKNKMPLWRITDDTQMTIATCEAIIQNESISAEKFANTYLHLFKKKRINGIGASTFKALRELDLGIHWSFAGRTGEYGAGNGAAMRIAPLAFCQDVSRTLLKEICAITHNNDEAYIGALCIIIAIEEILKGNWKGDENLIELIIYQIPDTRVKDRLIEINNTKPSFLEIGQLGNNGYVVNSIPLAIYAASKAPQIGMKKMYEELIKIGGDTDTNCAIAGQIIGTLLGVQNLPNELLHKLEKIPEYDWINNTIDKMIEKKRWNEI